MNTISFRIYPKGAHVLAREYVLVERITQRPWGSHFRLIDNDRYYKPNMKTEGTLLAVFRSLGVNGRGW